jgi:hypothetical protein
MVYLRTSAPNAADGALTAMALTFGPDDSVAGTAPRTGQKAPHDDAAARDRPRQLVENQWRDCCGRCGRKAPPSFRAGKHEYVGLEGTALSAAEALKTAGAAGGHVRIDGGDLDRQLRASLASVRRGER